MSRPPLTVQLATARARDGVVSVSIIAETAEVSLVFPPMAAARFAAFFVEALGQLALPPPARGQD
ncbi:MAG: hypothetical protein FD152_1275 [Xanthobacteraceae bacterium]|nr:MAG: hypothetical protein FD152_1275 [Xanthobacteraceae bacterium]